MSKINIGIIGCGEAARKLHLPVLRQYPAISKNLFLVDKNINQAREIAHSIGSSNYSKNYNDIYDKVQGVIVSVPHHLHYAVTMEFLKRKIHVLCEKPMAETFDEAFEMICMAKKYNTTLSVNNTRRLFPSFAKVKELIDEGIIGKLLSINYFESNKFDWDSNTSFYVDPSFSSKGVLLDLGSHVLDLICWWIGGKPELLSYEDDSFGGPESVVRLRAQYDSTKIFIFLDRLVDFTSYYKIEGELGTIEGKISDWKTILYTPKTKKTQKINVKTNLTSHSEIVNSIVNNFINIVKGKENSIICGRDVIDSIKLIEESYNNRNRFNLLWYHNIKEFISD